MSNNLLTHLGNCIRSARLSCHLTQKELAQQTGLATRTIVKIEAGKMNPSYKTLCILIKRLGISANILFIPDLSDEERAIQHIIGKLQTCPQTEQQFLLNTLDHISNQLLMYQQHLDSE